jgi:4-aminobutyrate aminotransferase-like enzyme
VAGLVSTQRITTAKPWGNPSGSSSSYGGNPLAAAAVDASLEIIEEERLVENSAAVGAFLLEGLRALQERYEFIGCVRGRGLLIGVELVRDRATREPLSRDTCRRLFQECARRGLLCMIYSPHFRVNPPLGIDRAAAGTALGILDEAMATVVREGGWR